MRTRIGLVAFLVLVTTCAGAHQAQNPPVAPDMQREREEQERQDRQKPRPPGVPVPDDSPIHAALAKLKAVGSYRMRMGMVQAQGAPPNPYAAMAARMGVGMPDIERLIVRPDAVLVTMKMNVPGPPPALKPVPYEVRTFIDGDRMARLFIQPDWQQYSREVLAQQIPMIETFYAQAMPGALAEGPAQATVLTMQVGLARAGAAAAEKKLEELFSWKCQSTPDELKNSRNVGAGNQYTDLRDIGSSVIGGVAVESYEFYVKERGEFTGPVAVHIARGSGLPVRLEMIDPQMGVGMGMTYTDFDKVPALERPGCMKD